MSPRVLPPRADLEQYKKQAKDLFKERSAGLPGALERIRQHHPRLHGLNDAGIQGAPFRLADAQLVIAREHDFESWPRFAGHVRSLQDAVPAAPVYRHIVVDNAELGVALAAPHDARGIVVFAFAQGSGRFHPDHRSAAERYQGRGFAVLLADLMTEHEEIASMDDSDRDPRFEIQLLGARLIGITEWVQKEVNGPLPLGYLASQTAAAVALFAAAERPASVQAIVSDDGWPDLAGPWLWRVQAPTLLLVHRANTRRAALHDSALTWFSRETERELQYVHTDGEESAYEWFSRHLVKGAAV